MMTKNLRRREYALHVYASRFTDVCSGGSAGASPSRLRLALPIAQGVNSLSLGRRRGLKQEVEKLAVVGAVERDVERDDLQAAWNFRRVGREFHFERLPRCGGNVAFEKRGLGRDARRQHKAYEMMLWPGAEVVHGDGDFLSAIFLEVDAIRIRCHPERIEAVLVVLVGEQLLVVGDDPLRPGVV